MKLINEIPVGQNFFIYPMIEPAAGILVKSDGFLPGRDLPEGFRFHAIVIYGFQLFFYCTVWYNFTMN